VWVDVWMCGKGGGFGVCSVLRRAGVCWCVLVCAGVCWCVLVSRVSRASRVFRSFIKNIAKDLGLLEDSAPTAEHASDARSRLNSEDGGRDGGLGPGPGVASDSASAALDAIVNPIERFFKKKAMLKGRRAAMSQTQQLAGGLDVVKHANPHLRDIVKVRHGGCRPALPSPSPPPTCLDAP
jgi:hypothetical protein